MSLYRDRRKPAPRLLNVQQAAAYCGVSASVFEAWTSVEPLRPEPGGKRKLWDIRALDAWLDQLSNLDTRPDYDVDATPRGSEDGGWI